VLDEYVDPADVDEGGIPFHEPCHLRDVAPTGRRVQRTDRRRLRRGRLPRSHVGPERRPVLEAVLAGDDELRVAERQPRAGHLRRAGRAEPGMPGADALDRGGVAGGVRVEQGSSALAQELEAGTRGKRE
jgi:hypothetical protein